ncbi:hypothetical protein AVEN_12224-1 [Araneus ventricosus]|uniref:Uncharacterized protein n=1 Tax=Araneus ventricosus TaxID=182803 RepID=A0A4Y2HZN1_ARAVE|nr:hypothetical protein AVEN_12224-1 [Araneus ventricosus]
MAESLLNLMLVCLSPKYNIGSDNSREAWNMARVYLNLMLVVSLTPSTIGSDNSRKPGIWLESLLNPDVWWCLSHRAILEVITADTIIYIADMA